MVNKGVNSCCAASRKFPMSQTTPVFEGLEHAGYTHAEISDTQDQ